MWSVLIMILNSNKARTGRGLLSQRVGSMLLGLGLVVCVVGATPQAASAQGVYFTRTSVLKSFFSTSERVTFKRFTLTDADVERVRHRLGYTPTRRTWTLYYGTTGGRVDGLAIIDEEMGQHEPITFATLIDPQGRMKRLEIMVYREGHGDEVRQGRFRRQFVGRTSDSPVRHGADIVAVSGATISSKAMAIGARRALILVHDLVLSRGAADHLLRTSQR